ncbi:MAG: hypothetical protein Q7S19_02650 [bacterium]|nr:hypothetical protein [bacterium]
MNKDADNEAEIVRRYIKLAGLIKDGRMVNRDKESRAREYVKLNKRIIDQIDERNKIFETTNYGKLILQSNSVQYYLIKLIILRSFSHNNEFEKDLERLPFGALVGYLNVCAQTTKDLEQINQLKNYKDKRDALAHKMFTAKKLTPKECELAIQLGDKIIKYLLESLKQKYMINGADKISEFPEKFNKLAKLVESMEDRMVKLEKEVKELKK